MSRIVYVNGRYLRYAEAGVHAEDRGFQFADAVYEVCEVRSGRLIDEDRHMTRLTRSLRELAIAMPMSREALGHVIRQTIARNRVRDGVVYLQISRGEGRRDFLFPPSGVTPTVVCIARPVSQSRIEAQAETGIAVKTMPDIRWQRSDIKTVMLLPACLAKEAARRDDAREAWFVDSHDFVTEGASSNAWIVDRTGALVTRQADRAILAGVTRATVMDAIAREGMTLTERPFSPAEARAAREAFITSATNTVMPVVKIDGTLIADGKPGPVARKLRSIFHQLAQHSGTNSDLRIRPLA